MEEVFPQLEPNRCRSIRLPKSNELTDCIFLEYSTCTRLISLTDICIHYLINHPEIPAELQEHIQKRKDDSYYRVLPMYSRETGIFRQRNAIIFPAIRFC